MIYNLNLSKDDFRIFFIFFFVTVHELQIKSVGSQIHSKDPEKVITRFFDNAFSF